MIAFRVAGLRLGVEGEPEAVEAARARLGPFLDAADEVPSVSLRLALDGPESADAAPLELWDGTTVGSIRVEGPASLQARLEAPAALDAALRVLVAFALPPPRFLLVHGVGLRAGDEAVVALGPSGAGKSTLCGLAAGAAFTSMSDETVVLEPGSPARVHATPFRSSCPWPPQPGSARLGALLALEQAAGPSLRPLPRVEAVELLLTQSYRALRGGLPDQLAAATALVSDTPAAVLAFAKEPSCVPLLRALLSTR